MTDFGRRGGDMLKSVYDPLNRGWVTNSQLLNNLSVQMVQDHAPTPHTHHQADVTNLATALAAKAALSHTHPEAEITDLDHDAQKIKGVEVDDTDKDNEKVLAFNSTSGNLEYVAMACGPEQIAHLGTASADSQWSAAFSAAKATDNDPGTRWLSHFGAPHWWQVEWATEKTIDYIEFTAARWVYNEHFNEYYIEHWDGDDWVEDIHVTGYTEESPTVTHHDLNVSTTIIRIRTIGQYDRHGIYEFRVVGC